MPPVSTSVMSPLAALMPCTSSTPTFVNSMLPAPVFVALKLPIRLPASLSTVPLADWVDSKPVLTRPALCVMAPVGAARLIDAAWIDPTLRLPALCVIVTGPPIAMLPAVWLKAPFTLSEPAPLRAPPLWLYCAVLKLAATDRLPPASASVPALLRD